MQGGFELPIDIPPRKSRERLHSRPATIRMYDGVEDVYARRGAPVAIEPS